ncbi:MAG: spore maturation protein CgeB [Solirubrobacteraceae bacterium]|nr:spore maturation protein CgeB [Solirubrobacteraceae bacterium]
MKILYVALRFDYGKPEQGDSFEHQTFHSALSALGHEIVHFDIGAVRREHGAERMSRRLWEVACAEDADLMFCVLFDDELDKAVVRRISEELRTVTVNWFCDDHWRFDTFSRDWAPCFNWVVTTAPRDLAPYEDHGLDNVIRSQWACNAATFRKLDDEPQAIDVSFVGMDHGDRAGVMRRVRRAGIDVHTWGKGWPAGRLTVDEMVAVFNRSRINLNLANVWFSGRRPARASRWISHVRTRATGDSTDAILQIKARTFEVPGCGGFLLTSDVPGLDAYFEPGREIVTFGDIDELTELITYYLEHEDERAEIARAGHARVLAEHTYERRFEDIFARLGQ